MEPRLESRPAMIVIGMHYRGKNENEEIPALWQAFWPRHAEIQGRKSDIISYGLSYNFDTEKSEFDYIAGFEVGADSPVPEGMQRVEVPAQQYAVFECSLPALMETIQYAYDEWVPKSSYQRSPDGFELEVYDERFMPDEGKLEMSLWAPIEPA